MTTWTLHVYDRVSGKHVAQWEQLDNAAAGRLMRLCTELPTTAKYPYQSVVMSRVRKG
jgi:hypothetical protein